MKAPAVMSKESDGNADGGKPESETNCQPQRRRCYIKARIGRDPSAVDAPWIVIGHVHHAGIDGSNQDLSAVIINTLLWRGSQIAALLSLHARGLNCVHHIAG